jgi:haloalkane dehalogenase
VETATEVELTPEQAAGYDAPYPSFIYKAGIRALPSMVTGITNQNLPHGRRSGSSTGRSSRSSASATSFSGRRTQDNLTNQVPGSQGQPHERFEANHFIQEDIGETLAERVNTFMAANPIK